ncbi:MAG: MMPL family transporter [Gammaproteobacteria bacterium]|nr:MMPL family transporter [Gammaproteobacteria bacterium]
MNSHKTLIIDSILRRPWTILLLAVIVTLLLGSGIRHLRFEMSTERLLLSGSETLQTLQQFRETFGNDDLLVVVQDEHTFSHPEAYARLKNLTERLSALPGVEHVTSLANMPIPSLSSLFGGTRKPKPLSGPLKGLVQDILISGDGTVAAIHINPSLELDDNALIGLVVSVDEIGQQWPNGLYLVGAPSVKKGMMDAAVKDTVSATLIAVLLVVLVLGYIFRDPWSVLVPLVTILLSLIAVAGFMGLFDIPLSSWTLLIVPLLFVIGIAGLVHILANYKRQCISHQQPLVALRYALQRNMVPCLLTSITTMLGFLSLTLGETPVLQDFGISAAFGVGAAFILSITFMPAVLMLLPRLSSRLCNSIKVKMPSIGVLRVAIGKGGYPIIGVTVLLCAVATYGVSRISVDTNILKVFKDGHPVSVAHNFVKQHLAGNVPLEVMVEGQPGQMMSLEALKSINDFQRNLEHHPLVLRTISLIDVMKNATPSWAGGGVLPNSRFSLGTWSVMAKLADKKLMSKLINNDRSMARITVLTKVSGTRDTEVLMSDLNRTSERFFKGGLRGHVTGTMAAYTKAIERLVNQQIISFQGACTTIFLTIVLVFRSLKVGLFSVIPNLLTVLTVFGVMGLGLVQLDFFNVMVASIALGIAVDNAIHFMARFQHRLVCGSRVPRAVWLSLKEVQTPIITTSLILGLGFMGIAFSASLGGTERFAMFTALAISVSLLATLFVLPVLVLRLWRDLGRKQ